MPCEGLPETAVATIRSCRWDDSASRAPSSLFVGHFVVAFSYVVEEIRHSGEFCSFHEWEEGTDLPILYNPQCPKDYDVCDEADESQALLAAIDLICWMFAD